MVRALILRSAGTNCNIETEQGFKMGGAQTEQVHINELISGEKNLEEYDIIAIPGGFSYGDYVAAGSILANQISLKLKEQIEEFIRQGKVVIGICNGFQVLVRAGLLPGGGMKATLTNNDSGKFECRWVKLLREGSNPLTEGIEELNVPVAHAEGKFYADTETIQSLEKNGQILFRYSSSKYPANPNGSVGNIAGISNEEGNVIGMMPHPERHLTPENDWRRNRKAEGEGLKLFRNIVKYCEALKNESIGTVRE